MLTKGFTAMTEAWTWLSDNDTFATIIGFAMAIIIVGGLLGIFLSRRG